MNKKLYLLIGLISQLHCAENNNKKNNNDENFSCGLTLEESGFLELFNQKSEEEQKNILLECLFHTNKLKNQLDPDKDYTSIISSDNLPYQILQCNRERNELMLLLESKTKEDEKTLTKDLLLDITQETAEKE